MFLLIVIVTTFIGLEIFPEWVQLGRYASVAVKKFVLTEISITVFEDGYPMLSWLTTIVSVNYVATRYLSSLGNTSSCVNAQRRLTDICLWCLL